MTDPAVAVVFFAVLLVVLCGVWSIVEKSLERRDRRASREMRRRIQRHVG